ncbi:hypothetical protein NDU88_003140 [Pleurodeles waltl]|uniref:Uncharacterized protein n=1 Tax=Pleurodeles waltl TaxID=8319 RepID=A0AAV7KXC3_PLEWA|nr:hypothetical protein NDU88_003140 [Pleurodeles waltl]
MAGRDPSQARARVWLCGFVARGRRGCQGDRGTPAEGRWPSGGAEVPAAPRVCGAPGASEETEAATRLTQPGEAARSSAGAARRDPCHGPEAGDSEMEGPRPAPRVWSGPTDRLAGTCGRTERGGVGPRRGRGGPDRPGVVPWLPEASGHRPDESLWRPLVSRA